MIMYEGVDRSCYDHSQCEVGMMCTTGGYHRKNDYQHPQADGLGQCSDCYYATHSDRDVAVRAIETLIFRFDRTFTASSNPYEIKRKTNITHYDEYCEDTDESPKKCDYIHNNVRLISRKAMMVLFFVAINLVNAILKDLDQGQSMQTPVSYTHLTLPTTPYV